MIVFERSCSAIIAEYQVQQAELNADDVEPVPIVVSDEELGAVDRG